MKELYITNTATAMLMANEPPEVAPAMTGVDESAAGSEHSAVKKRRPLLRGIPAVEEPSSSSPITKATPDETVTVDAVASSSEHSEDEIKVSKPEKSSGRAKRGAINKKRPPRREKRVVKEPSPFSLPITKTLLRENPLDAEIRKKQLGDIRFHKKTMSRKQRKAKLREQTNLGVAEGDWGALESTLEARKEIVNPPTRMAIARDWSSMPTIQMTPEQERDVRIIENRQHLDPKRFYKASGSGRKKGELPTQVAFGTVVEAPHEFYSSRLTKRERRKTITEEVMADGRVMDFTKNRVRTIQKHATRPRRVIDPAAKKGRRYHP